MSSPVAPHHLVWSPSSNNKEYILKEKRLEYYGLPKGIQTTKLDDWTLQLSSEGKAGKKLSLSLKT